MINFQNVEFIKSAVRPDDFIRDRRSQITFAGRSNVGKSSVINSVLRRKNYARVGNEPGKTNQINYFLVDNKFYITDLPGYGYAKVPKAERDRWAKLMEAYFHEPEIITGGVMIVDSRHKPTADDLTMANWFKSTGCPFVILANKVDKVKKAELSSNIMLIRETLSLSEDTVLIEYSAEKGIGRQLLVNEIQRLVKS